MTTLNSKQIAEIEELYNSYHRRLADREHDRNWEGAELMEQAIHTTTMIIRCLGYKFIKEWHDGSVVYHIEKKERM